jgi:hypothetical protein
MRSLHFFVLASGVLAACARSGSDSAFTVDYYRSHASEREATVRACENDSGELRDAPRCVNAREAARLEGVGSLKQLPPMGLPTSPSALRSGQGTPKE